MVTAMNIDTCTVVDIDSLTPPYYQARFARMVGYHVPGPGEHAQDADPDLLKRYAFKTFQCGACYYRGAKYQLRSFFRGERAMNYTYFKSSKHKPEWNVCEWTGTAQTNPSSNPEKLDEL